MPLPLPASKARTDIFDYKYHSVFESKASVIMRTADEVREAKASVDSWLTPLRDVLPPDVVPENNPDLLYIAANGAVAGFANKNDDAIDCATAVYTAETAKHKFISTEHDRESIVGAIIDTALTDVSTNQPLTPAQALALNGPFNMAISGVVWKVIFPMLAKYIKKMSGETGNDVLSLSWEIAYNTYDIGVGERNVFNCRRIKPEDPEFARYDKMLRSNGGIGYDENKNSVFCIITGNPIILGYSIVPNPAADVRGLLVVDQSVAPYPTDPVAATEVTEAAAQVAAQTDEKNITSSNISVNSNIEGTVQENKSNETLSTTAPVATAIADNSNNDNENNTMDLKDLITELNLTDVEGWNDFAPKCESIASMRSFILEKLSKLGVDYVAKIDAEKNLTEAVAAQKVEAEKQISELNTKIASIEAELNEFKTNAKAAELAAKFNERMASLDEQYELDAAQREVIASEIKSLDDESYTAYAKKMTPFMKKKGECGKKKAQECEKEEMKEEKKEEKCSKASETEATKEVIKEAFASVTPNKEQSILLGMFEVNEDEQKSMREAFASAANYRGKKIVKKNAE